MSGTSEDGKAGGAHPPESAQTKAKAEGREAAPGEAKEATAPEGRGSEAGAVEEANPGGEADAPRDADGGGAAADGAEKMPGTGEVCETGAEARGKAEPPGGPGWTEESIERLLKTLDSVSADAAETKSMLGTLTDVCGQGEARAIVEARERMRVHAADFHREAGSLRRRRWRAAVLAAAVPAALLVGLLAQKEFGVVPAHDPSKGWSGWVWETQGLAIVACALEAIRTDAEVDCRLVVRRP